jgi:ribosomal protein L37AE/L43A
VRQLLRGILQETLVRVVMALLGLLAAAGAAWWFAGAPALHLDRVPWWLWIIAAAIVGALLYAGIRALWASRSHGGGAFAVTSRRWIFGSEPVLQMEHAGVLWEVRAPVDFRGAVDALSAEAMVPPRCPKCKTEIEESPSRVRGYVWRCPECGFHNGSRDSLAVESPRPSGPCSAPSSPPQPSRHSPAGPG